MKAPKTKTRKQVMIVDDHPMMREGLAQLLDHEPDLRVCFQADTAAQAFGFITSHVPDLLLLDISLPDRSGVELIKDIQKLRPELPVLVVSMHDESVYAERVLRAGGRGYIMKQEGGKKLMQAVRQVLAGKIYVSDKMAERILELFSGHQNSSSQTPLARLSDREFEIFQLIGRAKGTREISQQLHLSVKTVEVHRANIRKKLELRTGADLVQYAIRWAEAQSP
jgi:DNA-binding NarL/FixJ family response regulator